MFVNKEKMKPLLIIHKPLQFIIDNLYIKPKNIMALVKRKELYSSKSYYPEAAYHSSVTNNLLYQIIQVIKYREPTKHFFMYGLDTKSNKERNEYLNNAYFGNIRNELNYQVNPHNSTCILRNKLYFDMFARSIGIATPRIVAYFTNDRLFLPGEKFKIVEFDAIRNLKDQTLFCKELEGECGAGIFTLTISSGCLFINDTPISTDELFKKIHGASYLFQEIVCQHPKMKQLHPSSINTIRLITVRSKKDGQLHVMPSILRIGTNGTCVDNTSKGGVAIGFDINTGQLHEYGFQKATYGGKSTEHPNTHIKYSDFEIPLIEEVKRQAIYFHSMLNDLHSVGWDIAIGDNGPIFIEGNDNWEINGPQVGNHGLRKEFNDFFFN